MEWQKAQGINHASEYSYSKETYKKHFSNDGLKLDTLIKDFFIFFNSVPSLDSRLRRIETSASEPHPYIRFWHGYQILTRPVLALSGIESLRFISACFFILSLTLIAYFLRKKEMGGGIIAGLFLILMLISFDTKEIITNYIHAITLSAMFLSSLATVYFNRAHQKILAGFWGMYFSFLLNIQIGLIMVFWLSWVAYQPKSLTIKEYKPLFKNTILWSIGILFSFFYKYGLVSFIFFNQNNISLFTDAVWDRSFAGHNTVTEFVYDYFTMLGSNLKFWSFLGFRFWIVLLSAFLVFIYQMTNKKLNKSYLQVELLIILLGFVSLGILLNHSLLHSIFVWRIMPFIASLIILTGITGILKRSR
jgi:hypothetical protein